MAANNGWIAVKPSG